MKSEGYMHSLNTSPTTPVVPLPIAIIIFVIVSVLGGVVAYVTRSTSPIDTATSSKPQSIQTDKAAGIVDKKTFKDSSKGVLREGGMEGEGNFHLERPGGLSQNVYLTSSTVDLSKYIGKKVTVWGQTFQGQKAGWLMDVGLVEIQ